MIVKFFNRGEGRGSGPVQYLLGRDFNREKALVLKGEPTQTIDLIDSIHFKKRYTSGVLSFLESDLKHDTKQKIMTSFENAIFSGLDKNQYEILWVEHRDKERLELNFVIPNVELTTGKRLQPYYDRADRTRINAWQTVVNAQLGLADPNDPARARNLSYANDLPKNREEQAKRITAQLTAMLKNGQIKNREDVLNTLKVAGLEITRKTKKSISILPNGAKKTLRLKGVIYEADFNAASDFEEERKAQIAEYKQDRIQRLKDAKSTYSKALEFKIKEHEKRFKVTTPAPKAIKIEINAVEKLTSTEITHPKIKELINEYIRATETISASIKAIIYATRSAIAGRARYYQSAALEDQRIGEPRSTLKPRANNRRSNERVQNSTRRNANTVSRGRRVSKKRTRNNKVSLRM